MNFCHKRIRHLPLVILLFSVGCANDINACLSTPEPDLDDATRDLSASTPVFPGAEGFGTETPGGRGGDIVIVTSLNGGGSGSLREALAAGDRTILFEVGGTIEIVEDIRISAPFVTIAGETAPSPGITIVGAGLFIETHDVVISHLQIRPGDAEEGPRPDVRDAITIARDPDRQPEVGNIVVDHCSLSWALDEIASTTYPGVHDVTFANNIIAEGLSNSLHSEGEHSKGLIIGDGSRRISVVRNLFAHNSDRNPVMKGDSSSSIINNVVYNPGKFGAVHYGLRGCCPMLTTFEGNLVLPGPDTPSDRGFALHVTDDVNAETKIFARDNCGGEIELPEAFALVDEPPVNALPTTVLPCEGLLDSILPRVGARYWDRSVEDASVISDVENRTGNIIDTPPTLESLRTQPATAHTLALPENPNEIANGYTNLELWLHRVRTGEDATQP